MGELVAEMIRRIFSFGSASEEVTSLTQSLKDYNQGAFDLVNSLHTSAVLPVVSVVISIIMVLEIARTASHIEGDHQLGAKIIAATMFKCALLVIAAQNAMLFLDAINEVTTSIIGGINTTDIKSGIAPAVKSAIGMAETAGGLDQFGVIVLLLIPFLLAMIARLVVSVVVLLRFAEMYMLTAFAALPIALLGHQETKSMGVGYLQRYATVSLHGATLLLSLKLYSTLANAASNPFIGEIVAPESADKLPSWVIENYMNMLLTPVMLLVFVLASGKLAKALVGQG